MSFALGILVPQATQLRSGTCRLFGKTALPIYCLLHYRKIVPAKLSDDIPLEIPQGMYWQKGLAATACSSSATAGSASGTATCTTAASAASATTATSAELFHDIFSEPNLASVRYQYW